MFRESSAIDSERTAASVRSLYAKYANNENWFDGSPDSVDRRIAQAKKISNLCKAATVRLSGRNASSQYIALAHEMDSDRTALEGLRRDLLTAASDREQPEYNLDDYYRGLPDKGRGKEGDEAADYREYYAATDREDEEPKHNPWGGRVCKECGGYFEDNGCICDIKDRNKTSMRSEARHFIAEQECDDLRELTIRAKHYAERTASILSVRESSAFVRSFVEAVRNEYKPPRRQRTASNAVHDFPAELFFIED